MEINEFEYFHEVRKTGFGGGIVRHVKNKYKIEQSEVNIEECGCMFSEIMLDKKEVVSILVICRSPKDRS